MYPIHSTAMLISLGTVRSRHGGSTEASYEQRDHDPGSRPYELIEVDHGGEEEQDGEYDGGGHGRVVAVILEAY